MALDAADDRSRAHCSCRIINIINNINNITLSRPWLPSSYKPTAH